MIANAASVAVWCWTSSLCIAPIPIDDAVIGLRHWQPQIQMGELSTTIREHNHWFEQHQQSLFLEYYVHPQQKLWTQFYRRRYVMGMCFLCEVAFMIYSGATDSTALSGVRISFMILWTLRWLLPILYRTFNKNIIRNLIDESGFYLAFHLNK